MTMFRSQRAARTALTKAERTYDAACAVWRHADFAGDLTARDKAEVAVAAAYDAMRTVYDAAIAQGWYINSYHCAPDPTRELVAANID